MYGITGCNIWKQMARLSRTCSNSLTLPSATLVWFSAWKIILKGNIPPTFDIIEYLLLQLRVLELHLLQLASLGLQFGLQSLCVVLAKAAHFPLVWREGEPDKWKIPSQKNVLKLLRGWLENIPELFVGFKAGNIRHRWGVSEATEDDCFWRNLATDW